MDGTQVNLNSSACQKFYFLSFSGAMLFCLSCGLGTYEFYVITAIPILKSPTLYPTQRRVALALPWRPFPCAH